MTPPPLLIDALADPGLTDVAGLLGEQVRFRSPYADSAGRADVAHLVGLIREVVVSTRITRQLSAGPDTTSQFDARLGSGDDVQGVLVEHRDDAGLLVEAMLTLRPYSGLRAAMRAMEPLMAAAPLPSRRP